MDWLNHPAYVGARERVVARFHERGAYGFRRLGHVVFLCGGAGSSRRDRLADYLRRYHPQKHIFYADDVWAQLATRTSLSALEMEAYLAELADIVMIVVESPGTFAELGAFSLSRELRRKLLPILDEHYRDEDSFINTGPVQWVNKESRFAPALHAKFSHLLSEGDRLDFRLEKLPAARAERIEDLANSPKHLVFFLCDLVAVVGPVVADHIEYLLNRILGQTPSIETPVFLSLAASMDLLKTITIGEDLFFYRRPENGELRSFHRKRFLNLAEERARVVSVLLRIDQARQALTLAV